MIFILDHFSRAPYMGQAVTDWRSVDSSIEELNTIAGSPAASVCARHAICGRTGAPKCAHRHAQRLHPTAQRRIFAGYRARCGVAWEGAFFSVLVQRLAGVPCSGSAWRSASWPAFAARKNVISCCSTARPMRIVMVDETHGKILGVNRTASVWTGRDPHALVGMNFQEPVRGRQYTRGGRVDHRHVARRERLGANGGDAQQPYHLGRAAGAPGDHARHFRSRGDGAGAPHCFGSHGERGGRPDHCRCRASRYHHQRAHDAHHRLHLAVPATSSFR
jgi:hypothetical protein